MCVWCAWERCDGDLVFFFSNSHSRHVWCRRCFWPRGVVRSLVAARDFFFTFSLSCAAFSISLWFLCVHMRQTDARWTTSLHFSVNAFFARATALAFLFFDFRAADCARREREKTSCGSSERDILQSAGSTFVNCFFIFYTGIPSEAKNFPSTTRVDELCSGLLKQN